MLITNLVGRVVVIGEAWDRSRFNTPEFMYQQILLNRGKRGTIVAVWVHEGNLRFGISFPAGAIYEGGFNWKLVDKRSKK